VGLRDTQKGLVQEEAEGYTSNGHPSRGFYFAHERLDVYQVGLSLVKWLDALAKRDEVRTSYSKKLDRESTSVVLNVAEGNGRFSYLDHRRFVDIAYTSAMKVAASLDMLVARRLVPEQDILEGKGFLVRLVPMLVGMRGYLDRQAQEVRANTKSRS
jgi:four helix bundle protein